MELDLNEFGKRYVTYTNYLFNTILVLGAVFIILVFAAPGETVGQIFLATGFLAGSLLLFLPVSIILAIIKRTRKFAGATLYTIAVIQLSYWWITALLLLLDKGGTWWAVVGVAVSFVTAGFGIFAVTVINALIHGSLTGVLMFIGIPLVCKLVMNVGKGLMEIHEDQITKKIVEFEKKQEAELDRIEADLGRLEAKKRENEKEIEELDEILDEIDHIESYYAFDDENASNDDEFDDEEYEDFDEYDSEENIEYSDSEKAEIERELAKTKKKIEMLEAQEAEARRKYEDTKTEMKEQIRTIMNRIENEPNDDDASPKLSSGKTLADMMHENPIIRDVVYEMVEEAEIPEGAADSYGRDALLNWRKGNRKLALELYNRSLEIAPNNAIELLNRGNLLIELGRFEEGIADLEKAASIDSSLPTQMKDVLRVMGSNAREQYRQHMLEKNADDTE